MKKAPLRISAVIFDFDGTLTKPGTLDFPAIRQAIGCPPDQPVLEFIQGLSDADRRDHALSELDRRELEAASRSVPNPGAGTLIASLQDWELPLGIVSRNSIQSIRRALRNFETVSESDFDVIITRDETVNPKPSPDGVLLAAEKLNVDPVDTLVVGDFVFDIQAGNSAGAQTVYVDHSGGSDSPFVESDYRVSHLMELESIVRLGIPLPTGKLPNDLLDGFLKEFGIIDGDDFQILITPGIGEDTAAIDIAGEQVLVVKADPITFTTDVPGCYAVWINANDIATSGATPRWFVTTLLFPSGTTPLEIRTVMADLHGTCHQCNICLCGGHTEITEAVTRPVVSGMMLGTVTRGRLIDKRAMTRGDRILLTKGVAVEGTSIIAGEFAERLRELGMADSEIEESKHFRHEISILEEARIAGGIDGVSTMHDVTEGGLATALEELGIAGRHRLRVDLDRIPVYPQTRKVCELLGLDPLGLIGSGSLIITCCEDAVEELLGRLEKAGVKAACIGEVMESGRGIAAIKGDRETDWPRFSADEITRLF